jgi:hypothetical protein
MYLGIMILIVSVLVVYFESKSREQNHKIASMFSIVSTLAEDMNQMKFAVGHMTNQSLSGGNGPTLEENIRPFSMQDDGQLIEVSDDDSSSDDDDPEEDDDDSSCDEDEVDESSSDDDNNEHDVSVKVFKIGEEITLNNKEEDNLENIIENSALEIEEIVEETPLEESVNEIQVMKIININLDENESEESVDYKKFSLQKLKTLVIDKGLVTDSSKLKKPELLKLLGIE